MNNIKKLSLPTFLLWSIFFSLNAYSSDLSLNEEERESTMHYSFSFTNNFPGDKDYSSNIVLIIVEKNDEKKAFDRRVLKVNYLETLQVALPYNIIRMNVYMSSPLIENSPRKEYTSQEFLEKYGRLPSPRHSPRKDYASGKSCFVTYENIELPCSMIFDSECELHTAPFCNIKPAVRISPHPHSLEKRETSDENTKKIAASEVRAGK